MTRVILNGKFLSAAMTGVHRVATELANAHAELAAAQDPRVAGIDFEVWYPADGAAQSSTIALPGRMVRPLRSIPWEQLTLPVASRGSMLLNLCNIGPVVSRNAITMIHDIQVHLSPASYSRGFRLWYRLVQPLLARRHRMILTVSHFSKREIVRAGLAPEARVAVVHNGADHILRARANRAVVDRLGLDGTPYVLALASTQAHKNIARLLESFADPALGAIKLVLFGGNDAADFAAAGLKLPDNLVFAGRVSDDELRGLVESALCLAFPSTTEGFGLPPLEAMLLGCPAIVAPCGALPEVCGDAALYAAPDQTHQWVRSIALLAKDPAVRATWSARGIAHAKQFSWRSAALTLAQILRQEINDL